MTGEQSILLFNCGQGCLIVPDLLKKIHHVLKFFSTKFGSTFDNTCASEVAIGMIKFLTTFSWRDKIIKEHPHSMYHNLLQSYC